jgi:hypothetical protein
MTEPINLAAWRAARQSEQSLPSGLSVKLRRVNLIDLAANGKIPTPLIGQAKQMMSDAQSAANLEISLEDFAKYAAVIDLVAAAALLSPPVAAEADDTHIAIHELPIEDRLHIFNWAQQEAAPLATFPDIARGGAVTRGRPRLRAATESTAQG